MNSDMKLECSDWEINITSIISPVSKFREHQTENEISSEPSKTYSALRLKNSNE